MNRQNRTRIGTRLKNSIQKNRLLFSSFAIPALILMIAYFSRGVFPIGNRNVLTIDLYHQYAPFLAELQARLRSGGGIFYSFSGGLGTNFYALFAYYLASPLNVLLAFFPPAYLTEAILLIILSKVGLAGASFHYFLRGVHGRDSVILMVFGSAYALSSYTLAYGWNVMWLDGIFLLPLLILGLVRVVRDRRYILFPFALGLTLLTNYYIAYFICLFTALYAILVLFTMQDAPKPIQMIRQIAQLTGLAILGAGLSAVLVWPTYLSLKLTSAANDSFPEKLTSYFDLFDYISRHFMLMTPTIRDGMPNLYGSLLALILIPVFFFAPKISFKSKFFHFGMLLTLIVSFNFNMLNFIWHGFHFPNQLPYRNSFVYIFLILSMAYPAFKSLSQFTGKQIGAIVSALMVFVLLAQKLNAKPLPLPALYATLVFLAIYAGVLTLNRLRPLHPTDWAVALLLVMVAELTVNTLVTMHTIDTTEYLSSREGYTAGVEVQEIRDQLERIARLDKSFYRAEVIPPKTINDGFLYQYNGLSIFASTSAAKPVKFFEKLGFHSNSINSYKYEGSTIVLDSLFGIKYLLRRTNFIDDRLREPISVSSEVEVFRNPYAQALGFGAPSAFKAFKLKSGDPLKAQSQLIEALGGAPDVLIPLAQEPGAQTNLDLKPVGSNGFNYTRSAKDDTSRAQVLIKNPVDQQVYLYLNVTANQPDQGYVLIDDIRVDFNAKRSTLVDLGFVQGGARVEFNLTFKPSSNASGTFSLYSNALNDDAFIRSMAGISDQRLEISRFSDTHILGEATMNQAGIFVMTLPYDTGWHVQVDGTPVETFAIDEGLLAFDLTAGAHTIDLRFTPPGFWHGLAVSGAALILLLILGITGRRSKERLESNPVCYNEAIPKSKFDHSGGIIRMAKTKKFFRCKICGNLVGLINDGGGELVCCGEPMVELVANTTDAATEKHVPVLTRNGNQLHVAVGSVAHPMTAEHLIQWIYVSQGNLSQRVALEPGQAPAADFIVSDGPVTVFEYCNLHGLWTAEG